ncbi:MAG: lamin tail domain-containing protein, partial [Thermoanaerobaculia bacterium]
YYRRAYLVRLWDALLEKYTPALFERKLEALRELLYEEQLEDIAAWGRSPPTANDPTAPAGFDPNLDRVRSHIQARRTYLQNYLRTTEGFTGHDRLKITEVMYNPPGGGEGEFLELWNNSGRSIAIGNWSIDGLHEVDAQGARQEFRFPAGALAAAGEVIIVAKDPVRFAELHGSGHRVFGPYPGNLDNGGETLRVRDAGSGHPATVDFLRYGAGDPWPSRPDGLGNSLELFDVATDRDNDLPENWRSSTLVGGSPGAIHRPGDGSALFRRGNCNGDARVDLADAVAVLLHLFAGGPTPSCLDGCDVNGNLAVAVDDAVALLKHLYAPGGFPIPSP